jgi:hypothetical protein
MGSCDSGYKNECYSSKICANDNKKKYVQQWKIALVVLSCV